MAEKKIIEIPDFITVRDLATLMAVSPINIIKELMGSGIMVNINQEIDFDTASIVAEEMGFDPVEFEEEVEEDDGSNRPEWRKILSAERKRDLVSRPPVITMLGHVDHGKTSLLDVFRQANVADGEHGGITQHIGAYQTKYQNHLITFLDTPGHAAFTQMRARGARSTDIAILVVAADDGLMPQTLEAIDHAKAAKVPIIVALNKIDLPGAQPDRAKQQLVEAGLAPDDWDGETLVIEVSAKEKIGIDDLMEAILLTAEELNPQANPNAMPSGTVIESKTERGKGVTATLLIQNGTLKVGDTLLINDHYGRIKAMFDHTGKRIKEAGPSVPVQVSGLNGTPSPGEQFKTVESEKVARRIVSDNNIVNAGSKSTRSTLDAFFANLQTEDAKPLRLIVKADVEGSLEPIVSSLRKLKNEEVELEILRAATGSVTESDVMLASASDAIILGFNTITDPAATLAATSDDVEIRNYTIIYHLLEDVEKAMRGLMAPRFEQVIIGRAEVRVVFPIRKIGNIAGCFMRTGEGRRNANGRVIRDKKLLHDDKVSSLRHIQSDVREIREGFEFGVKVGSFEDYQENDLIEFYITRQVPN
ncbi:MAG: translation initiation factor IF-2 [Cellvibrionaceae bacterium]|jgi:translation initiation factor IF-2